MIITPLILEHHLHENGISPIALNGLLNPADKQDVPKALKLLKAIWDCHVLMVAMTNLAGLHNMRPFTCLDKCATCLCIHSSMSPSLFSNSQNFCVLPHTYSLSS